MRYTYVIFLFILLGGNRFAAAQDEVAKRIVLIGNAGLAVKENRAFFTMVRNSVSFDSNTVVLFLGNNMRVAGDTAALREEAALIANTAAKAIFLPGHNDWANGKDAGYNTVLAEQLFLEGVGNKNIKFYPGDACPGPEDINLGNGVTLLVMDSQWWLHEYTKPGIESGCKFRTKDEVLAELEDIVEDNMDKLLLVAAYHPFFNKGIHSGSYGVKQHVFPFTDASPSLYIPLPLVGSLYPITRNAITTKQDLNNAVYARMAHDITRWIDHPNLIYLAGQERNMQLLDNEGVYHIVSGASAKPTRVRHTAETKYAAQQVGFTVLEVLKNKKVTANFYEISGEGVKQAYSAQLLDFSKLPPVAEDTATMPYIAQDSFVTKANGRYENTFGLNRFFAGNNYRDIWAQDVNTRVFHIKEEKGGLKITGLGGGHQSKSLQMEDKDGEKWVLRTVNKNLAEVMPPGLENTIAKDVTQDMISSSNPYGALVVPDLLSALGIVHATPEVVFVPNDTLLGRYRPAFANTLGLLEERDPVRGKDKSLNTMEAVHKLVDEEDHVADAEEYLRARAVDYLVADFDRHYSQWKWGVADTGKGKLYYPIPKDRDQALFASDGLLMKLARRRQLFYMENFQSNIRNTITMSFPARDIDMFFLSGLNEQDWKKNLAVVNEKITDSVIESAVLRLPPEVYAKHGEETRSKLAGRRNTLVDKSMEYYRFLSRRVNVTGTNKDDIFKVSGENGGLWVHTYAKDKDGDTIPRYSRWFDPAVTKEIRLYGFNGSDYFEMAKDTRSEIHFRIVGGPGNDTFNLQGGSRNHIYDLKTEDNAVLSKSRTTNMFSRDASVNAYRFRDKTYNSFKFPMITLGWNEDDGVLAGLGVMRTTYGFRQDSFATRQKLTSLFALGERAMALKYKGEFIDVIRHFDITAQAELLDPVLNYFFGYGNESKNDKTKPLEYYRTRYDYTSADLMLRKRFLNYTTMSVSLGPTVYYYWNNANRNKDRILEFPSELGLDSASVYSSKLYGGGKLAFNIDNVNSEILPTQGIDWKTELTMLKGLNANTQPLTKLQSDLVLYATLSHPSNLVAVIRAGGGHIFSNHFEYFQALSVGSNNALRGFRKNRFTGSSMAYAGAELRMKLLDINGYIMKGDFGVVGLGEVGRVWMKGETSHKWHNSYGGGLYITPFNMIIISAVAAISEEETMFNASLGTRLNIVFQGIN